MIRKYAKGTHKKVQPNLESSEFDCRCRSEECKTTLIDDDLVLAIQMLRDQLGTELFIRSGFRCAAYQADLKKRGYETARGVSTHELGMAADVFTRRHTGQELADLAMKVGLRRIGIADGWIHIDTKSLFQTPNEVTIWRYGVSPKT